MMNFLYFYGDQYITGKGPARADFVRCLPPFKVRAGVLSSEWDDWQWVPSTSGFSFFVLNSWKEDYVSSECWQFLAEVSQRLERILLDHMKSLLKQD